MEWIQELLEAKEYLLLDEIKEEPAFDMVTLIKAPATELHHATELLTIAQLQEVE